MRQWSKPIALSRLREFEIPERSGVYVLLGSLEDPSEVLKIGSARSLRRAFIREMDEPSEFRPIEPVGFLYFESVKESQEETRFMEEFRRKRGERPMYNSGF